MNKAETIAYAIEKECKRYSLVHWCEEWGFTVDDFDRFLEFGKNAFKESDGEQDEN